MYSEYLSPEEWEISFHSRNVEERLKKLGITYYTAHRPDNIPSEQI
ncbi:MAG: hypothetical protein GW873_04140 [Nitrospirae bacterium]|nr:hypothetical protein [Nitrospirota bacterium]